MPRILVDALVGVDPDLAGLGQEIGALRRQPAVEQIVRQPFPQPDLEHLPQPGLSHDQDQQRRDDQSEHQKLSAEGRQVALLERVEKAALPGIEPDLANRIGADHNEHAGGEQPEAAPVRRRRKRRKQRTQLRNDAISGRQRLAVVWRRLSVGRSPRSSRLDANIHGAASFVGP